MRTRKKFRPGLIIIAAISAGSVWISALQASVVRFMPFQEQVSTAEIIVVAQAGSQVSSWDSQQRFIFTETTFQIEQAVKGTASGTVTLRQLGGQVGEIGQSAVGSAVIVPGRKYVLFLEPRTDGSYRIVGFNQGCYPITGSSKGKASVTTRTAAADGKKLLSDKKDYVIGSMGLNEFLSRIRTHLKSSSE